MLPDFERLPDDIYTVSQVREMDRATIEEFGVAGYTLMQRAAAGAFDLIRARYPGVAGLRIYCGLGNNAGDGYVLACLAQRAGLPVQVVQCAAPEQLKGDAATAWRDCSTAGIAAERFNADTAVPTGYVAVDALFGTGLARPLSGVFAQAAEQMNAAGTPIFALDVPSGLDADTGAVDGIAVRADCTLAFVGLKAGYFLGVGPDLCGHVEYADLEIPTAVRTRHRPSLRRLGLADVRRALPPRSRLVHKGDCGRLLVIGGGPGMPGAARLAGEAALRAGAGLVYVVTHPGHAAYIAAQRPELIVHGVESPAALERLALSWDAVVLGPGLGRSAWATALCEWAVARTEACVIDADGLNWLAEAGPSAGLGRSGPTVLTPHPGEAGRLLGTAAAAVQQDRRSAVTTIAQRFAAVAVLKGACTLLAAGTASAASDAEAAAAVRVCLPGNPGMATPGTGDVLAGLIGGVLVQCGDAEAAAAAAVLIHALAGDTAAAAGERGMLASDLLAATRQWLNLS